jgi:hypothetical protein
MVGLNVGDEYHRQPKTQRAAPQDFWARLTAQNPRFLARRFRLLPLGLDPLTPLCFLDGPASL